jgi:ABC-type protease/lipase transport system fused ATPase/permease subunit
MIAASIVTARALAPIEQAVAHWRSFVGARQALFRLANTMSAHTELPISTQLPRPSRTLVAVNVATAPERDQKPLASGINFKLEAGDGLGVVGLSGSGKSSLARALVGVWPLLAGQIRLDGSELSHFNGEELGAATGYLPQAVELFPGTVAENISRFQPGDVTDAVLKAAQQAQLHDLIAGLPRGYDTQIGRYGAVLSAGQRQRIGLARALYGDPFLIVLDEPNSNLDGEGDQALTKAILSAKARGAIVIIVAHRPSAIAALDKLLLMENGRQVRFGEKGEVLQAIGISTPRVASERIEPRGGASHADAIAG